MELQTQIHYANQIGTLLLFIGLITISIGVGHWLSIQAIMGSGCEAELPQFGEPSTCQKAIQTLNARVTMSLVAGVVGMVSGGGILYYLRRNVP